MSELFPISSRCKALNAIEDFNSRANADFNEATALASWHDYTDEQGEDHFKNFGFEDEEETEAKTRFIHENTQNQAVFIEETDLTLEKEPAEEEKKPEINKSEPASSKEPQSRNQNMSVEDLLVMLFVGLSFEKFEFLIKNQNIINIISVLYSKKFHTEKANPEEIITDFQSKSNKRDEEKLKFVFSKSWKGLIMRLSTAEDRSKGNKMASKKRIVEDIIIKQWIEPVARANGLDVGHYLLPDPEQEVEGYPLTFDKEYISRIANSGTFAKEILKEIKSQKALAKKDCEEKIRRCMAQLAERYIEKNDFEGLKSYLRTPKSKLPWTLFEVCEAFEFVEGLLKEAKIPS